jgi:hypothetical protein
MPRAPGGTGTWPTIARVCRSITLMRPLEPCPAATYARRPSSVSATARVGMPTSGRATTFLRPRSTIAALDLPVVTTAKRAEAAGAATEKMHASSTKVRSVKRITYRN